MDANTVPKNIIVQATNNRPFIERVLNTLGVLNEFVILEKWEDIKPYLVPGARQLIITGILFGGQKPQTIGVFRALKIHNPRLVFATYSSESFPKDLFSGGVIMKLKRGGQDVIEDFRKVIENFKKGVSQ